VYFLDVSAREVCSRASREFTKEIETAWSTKLTAFTVRVVRFERKVVVAIFFTP
jgi:hypothetical protein